MSNSNEALKKCCRCQNILLKSNFNKDKTIRDGVQGICAIFLRNIIIIEKSEEVFLTRRGEKQISISN